MLIKNFEVDLDSIITVHSYYRFYIKDFCFDFFGSFVIYDSAQNIVCCSEDKWLGLFGRIRRKSSDKKVEKKLVSFLNKLKKIRTEFYKINAEDYLFVFEEKYYMLFFKDVIEDKTYKYDCLDIYPHKTNEIKDYEWIISEKIEKFDVSLDFRGIIRICGKLFTINYFFKIMQNGSMVFSSYDIVDYRTLLDIIKKVDSFLIGEYINSIDAINKFIIVISLSNNKQIFIYKDSRLINKEFISIEDYVNYKDYPEYNESLKAIRDYVKQNKISK